jgi:cytochrome c2
MRAVSILALITVIALSWSCKNEASAQSGEPAAAVTPAVVPAASVEEGKRLFAEKTCSACHQMDARTVGPPLRGVVDRRGEEWVFKMIQSPGEMVEDDPTAKKLFEEYNGTPMPDLGLSEGETRAIVAYLAAQ